MITYIIVSGIYYSNSPKSIEFNVSNEVICRITQQQKKNKNLSFWSLAKMERKRRRLK